MPTTGLWPREAPRTTASNAEVRVWEALGKHLPDGWAAWHSLRIRDARGIDDVYLMRLEQFYPFPAISLVKELESFKKA